MGERPQKIEPLQVTISTNSLEELQVTKRTVKRAQYEALEFTLSPEGVQVRNNSHANPDEHEYLVEVEHGVLTSCTCPADANYSGACKHRIAVAIRRPILDAVTHQQLVADGGFQTRSSLDRNGDEVSCEEDPDPNCDCADLRGDFPCWECYRNGRHELPSD